MKSFINIVLALVVSLLATANVWSKDKKEQRPNIVFILIDDLGWKDVGYMRSEYYETPNIDALAANGVVFMNAYAPASNCAPSRACMVSGQNTPRHGIYTVGSSERGKAHTRKLIPIQNTKTLADSIVTISDVLKAEGYITAQIGKWHLGDDPCTQGFDINVAGTHAGHPKSYFSPYRNTKLEDGPEGEYLTDRLTNEAIRFINETKAESSGQPFFLYLPYYTVHTPLQGKADLIQKYERKEVVNGQGNAVYAAMVESADENVGRLLQALKQEGILENTLLIFFSDNGGIANVSSQSPARAGKGSYYEGGIREPLIISWPKYLPKDKVVQTPVTGLDFFPTIMEAAGIITSNERLLDDESLLSLMKNDEPLQREAMYWHFPIYLEAINPSKDQARDPLFRTRPGSVMRKGKWKLHEYFEDGGLELYNLEEDPGESHNLAEELPELTIELLQQLRDWREMIIPPVQRFQIFLFV